RREGGGGQQDDGAEHADGERADDAGGQPQRDAATNSDAVGDAGEAGGDLGRDLLERGRTEALDEQPSADGANGEGEDSEHPERVKPGQSSLWSCEDGAAG